MIEKAINILLIEAGGDESALLRRSLADSSDGFPIHIKEAARLSAGCRLLARERFDAVLIDLALSQGAGIEGFRKVRAQAPSTPVVVLTGLQDEAAAIQAVREGAQDYVIKGTPDCCLLKRALRHAIERSRLARELELKSQFVGRISHELRNSLATVKTAVFCLDDGLTGPLAPRQARLVEMISRNVDRQVRLIDNILDLARLQSGKLKMERRPVALAALIEELRSEFRLNGGSRRLETDLPESLPMVDGDADLLIQVLRNLLNNACRFARGRVTVKAAQRPGEVVVSVADDGPGIPAERIGELFGAFVQLDRPREGRGYKGTGLGLAICKEVVEGHGGRIWAESVPGAGACFHFALPARVRDAGERAAAVNPRSPIGDAAGMAGGGAARL
jgi:signal transduction histidine kinase